MTHSKFVALQLKHGDVIEVRCGREIRIFTCKDTPHTGQTMVDAVDTDGKAFGIYFQDVICPHCGKPIPKSLAASTLRSIKSPKRSAASRANGKLGGRPRSAPTPSPASKLT